MYPVIETSLGKLRTMLKEKTAGILRIRFYSRLMLISMMIFITVAYGLAFAASKYDDKFNMMKYQQQNRDVLNALYNYYEMKHVNFRKLIYTLYENKSNYDILFRMLKSKSDKDYLQSPESIKEMSTIAHDIMKLDEDVATIFFYKTLTQNMIVYENGVPRFVDKSYPYYEELAENVLGRRLFGMKTLDMTNTSQDIGNISVYGIGGTLATFDHILNVGHFMIAYKTDPLDNIIAQYADQIEGCFLIMSDTGRVIYEYGISNGIRKQYHVYPGIDALLNETDHTTIDGTVYRLQIINISSMHYMAVHMIPEKDIIKISMRTHILIYLIVTVMAVLCVVLYGVSGKLASRRVRELGKAMVRVGSNNLAYRITVRRGDDEYREIATRFNAMCDELQETINRVYVTEIKKKNAELNALQSGINPHFLYNTLDAIKNRAHLKGDDEIADMILLLANLYRNVVMEGTFIAVRDELDMCSLYLGMLSLRYSSNISVRTDIAPGIMDYGIPKILLQPIIENYFMHGIRENHENNIFQMMGHIEGGDICFCFEDNGRGIGPRQLMEIQERLAVENTVEGPGGRGLPNVNNRIKLVYGQEYGLWVDSVENEFTRVMVRIKAMTCDELAAKANI